MAKLRLILFLVLAFFLVSAKPIKAQTAAVSNETYFLAKVVNILEEKDLILGDFKNPYQQLQVELESGPNKGQRVQIDHGGIDSISESQKVTVAEEIVLSTFGQLFIKGMRIGREHVTSLVNTLVMAYAGASLPLFLMFALNPGNQPVWTIFNNELIAEEIIRTLSGSFGLVLAVPLTTILQLLDSAQVWY